MSMNALRWLEEFTGTAGTFIGLWDLVLAVDALALAGALMIVASTWLQHLERPKPHRSERRLGIGGDFRRCLVGRA
jgi:hypothetical protein